MKTTPRRARATGFTLVEIAMVLLIVGLITAGIFAMLTTFLKSTRAKVAGENSAVVQQALQRFIERNGRLPCPAVPTLGPGAPGYGIEDTVVPSPPGVLGASCPNVAVGVTGMARGVVPWMTLGLPLDQVQDGYAHMFTYHVTIVASQTNAANVSATRGNMTIHTATPTNLGLPTIANPTGNQINSCWIAAAPPPGENSCNMNAIVVLLSNGENGAGAFTSTGGTIPVSAVAAEAQNTDNDVAFVKGDPTGVGFDDVVFAWSPDDLFEPLARQGTLKSATAATNETLRNTAIAISNFMVANANVPTPHTYKIPAVSPVALPLDAWGNAVVYAAGPTVVAGTSELCSTSANMPPVIPLNPGAVVFTVASLGLDAPIQGLNASTNRNDDITVSVTVDAIRNQILSTQGAPPC